jgi:hypothetical protein
MNLIEKAKFQRELILKAMENLDDQDASRVPEFYTTLKYNGALVPFGTRINWNGVLKKVVVDIWDTEENNPDNSPSLWVDIEYKDGIRIIPETITVSTAFAKDELGWWGDILYKSLVDYNVYNPNQYAANWIVVE